MASPFDSVRTKVPWMKDLSDDDILLKTSEITGMPLADVADYYGYEAPSSSLGKEFYAGGNRYLAGMGHIGAAMGIPGAAEYTKRKEARADVLQGMSTAPHSWEEMKFGDPEKGFLPYAGQLVAGSAPYMAEAAGYTLADVATGGALTPAIIARYAPAAARLGMSVPEYLGGQGLRAGATFAERRAALTAAEKSAPALARTAMIPAVTYPSSLGDVLGNQQEEAGRYNLPQAMAAAAPYSALNILGVEGAISHGALPRLGIKGLEKGMAGRAVSGALATGTSEAINEAGQEVMNQYGRMGVNPSATLTDPGALERYKESAIGGAVLGGLPGSLHAFGGRKPLDTKTPADLTKRLPDGGYGAMVEASLGLKPGEAAPYTPEQQREADLAQRERDVLPGLVPRTAAAPVYSDDLSGQYERAYGLAPGSMSLTAPVAAAAPKPKTTASAAKAAAAAPAATPGIDPVADQVRATKLQLHEAFTASHPPPDTLGRDWTPGEIHQNITRLVGNPQSVEQAAETLKGKIAATILNKDGKATTGVEKRVRAEKMIQFYNHMLGVPEAQQMDFNEWARQLEAQHEADKQAVALATAKVGQAAKIPGAVTTVDPATLAATPSTAATAAPTPAAPTTTAATAAPTPATSTAPEVPAKPKTPAEVAAYKLQAEPVLKEGLTDDEWQAISLTQGKETNIAGGTEAPKTLAQLKQEGELGLLSEQEGAPGAGSTRAIAKKLGMRHTTFVDLLKRARKKIAANATRLGLDEDTANEILGLQSSHDIADVFFPTTRWEGGQRVNVDEAPDIESADVTEEPAATEEETEAAAPEEAPPVAQAGEEVAGEGEAEAGGEAEAAGDLAAKKEVETENKWVDHRGQPIVHADVQDAQEEYEAGRADDEPTWDKLSPKLQLTWVRGYVAAYDLFPKSKEGPQRQQYLGRVRKGIQEAYAEQGPANETDTGTAGADTGPDRQAEKGPDDARAAEGVGREVGGVSGADAQADQGGVPPARAEGEKAGVAEEAGAGAGAAPAPVVKRKKRVVAGGKAEAVSTPEGEKQQDTPQDFGYPAEPAAPTEEAHVTAARELLASVDAGGTPLFISQNMRNIAEGFGMFVTKKKTTNADDANALVERIRAAVARVDGTPTTEVAAPKAEPKAEPAPAAPAAEPAAEKPKKARKKAEPKAKKEKAAPAVSDAAARTLRLNRARRQWLDAFQQEPAVGRWDDLSTESQEEFIAANDDEQALADVISIKLGDPSAGNLAKVLDAKKQEQEAIRTGEKAPPLSPEEKARNKWDTLFKAASAIGSWDDLTTGGQQEFTALPANKQNVGGAVEVKQKDNRWKEIMPAAKGNMKQAVANKGSANKYLNSDEYAFLAVRSDADIPGIMENGVHPGTNVSLDRNGQAFEDEGGTILVFRKADINPRTKEYQNDGVTQKRGMPVAIIKDTSLETRDEVTDEGLDAETDRLTDAIEANDKLADGLWRGAGLEKLDRHDTAAQTLYGAFYRVSLEKGDERADALSALRKKLGDHYDRAKEVYAESNRLDKQVDSLNAKLERGATKGVSNADVLAKYKQHGIPVYALPEYPSNMKQAIRAAPGVDMTRMAKLLGPQLYGNMSDVAPVTIKELFQNSFDALKGAIERGQRTDGEISIDLDKDARTITLTDNGTGMTPHTINTAFLTLAGTKKETERASGGLGIAKMLFLFGNKSLKLVTVRDGVESTLETSGSQLMEAFSDPSKAPNIETRKTDKPSGTTVTVEIPATFRNEETDADEEIKFPVRYQVLDQLEGSPLFEDITVKLNGSEVSIGKNFPADQYTVLSVAKFAWGKVRVLVAPSAYPGYENVNFLSNGLLQFKGKIAKDPTDQWSGPAPYKFFFNIEPSVKADAPNYPIALNRKKFSQSAQGDFETLLKYLAVMYANTTSEESSQSFGTLQQFSEDGKNVKNIDLKVPKAQAGTTLRINKDDKVELRDGRMYVNNRVMPEMTKEELKKLKHDPGQFRVDQNLLDPDLPIVHDNVLLNDKPYLDEARAVLGDDAVNGYLLGVSRVFKFLRDAVGMDGGTDYVDVGKVPVGVSIDTDYHGVNTMVPFQAVMINPTTDRGDIKNVARDVVGTMIHELAHHAQRNHSETGFIPELQRLFMTLADSGAIKAARADLERVMQDHAQVYDYFVKETKSGNLKNRGIRLEGGAQVVGRQGAANGPAAASGGRGNAGNGTGLRQAVGSGGQNRPPSQGRQGPSATHGGSNRAATAKHLTNLHSFAQRHGLGFMITEDIADLAAANGLREVRDYVEATKQREGAREEFEVPVSKVAELYEHLPERERGTGEGSVNKFIHDATLRGDTNGINRLSPSGQALVKAVFQHGKDTLALKQRLIEEEVGKEYNQRIAEETDDAKKNELLKERNGLLKRFSKLWTKGASDTYAPLKRFGDYVVSAKSAEYVQHEEGKTDADRKWISDNESNPAHVQMHFADTQAEADALEAQIKREYDFEGGKTYAAAREADIHNSRDLFRAFPVLQTRLEAEHPMPDGKVSPMARLMRDMYLEALAENTARKNELRRRGIAGASTDMVRAFVTQGRADAHYLANLKHNDAVVKAVQAMRKGAERDRRTLTPYLNEMLQRHAASYENHSNSTANRFKRVTSIWMLATNPTYYLQQVAQPWVMSLPVIAGRHGYWRTARALREGYTALESVLKGTGLTGHIDWSQAPVDVRDMLNTVSRNGAIDVTNSMDMGEWKLVDKGKAGAAWNRVDQKLRGLNTRVEAINRASTAIASYRLELARNDGDKVAATRYAEAMVRQTHGSYDGSNTPRYMQGSAAQVLTQFRRFQIIQISLIARLAHNAFKGSTAEEKAIGRRALTYTLLHTGALGGALGMPGAMLIASLVARLFGPSDEPPDFEKWAREAIGDQIVSDLLLKGVPAMLGVDLSSKFGMGQMLSVAPFADFPYDRKSFEKYVFAALGPSVGLGAKAVDGLAQIYAGHLEKGAELLLPTGFGNAMKGIRYATEGISLRKGDTVMSKDEIGFADALLQGLGLPTTTITHQQRLSQTKYEFDTYYHDRTAALINDYQQARKNGEPVADVIAEWQQVQEARVRNGYTRQPLSTLIKSAQQQRKAERNTAGGVEFVKANKHFVQEQANL